MPTAKAATPKKKAATAEDGQVVATWKGGQLTVGDVNGDLEGRLRAMEVEYLLERYELQAQALQGKVDEQLLEAQAKKKGFADVDALLAKEIEESTPDPTAEEIAAFYPLVQRQLGGKSLEEAYPQLLAELKNRAMGEKYGMYIADLREKADVNIDFPYPELPRAEITLADHDPYKGPKDAEITIVQFAEYQCFYCQKVGPTLDQVMANYPGKVKLVFMDFPLNFHDRAEPAAIAAHCASDQGKYWEMNELLLANQNDLSDMALSSHATKIGLDVSKWQACRSSGKYDGVIAEDMEQGQNIGVQATPTFFINGILVSGAQPYDRFASIIDKELAN